MQEVRLIDADALLNKLSSMRAANLHGTVAAAIQHDQDYTQCMNAVSCAPTIDAEPVRHGRWIEYTYWIGSFGQIHTKCSECGTDYPCRKGSRGDGKGGKFCEECGAKMDLEE